MQNSIRKALRMDELARKEVEEAKIKQAHIHEYLTNQQKVIEDCFSKQMEQKKKDYLAKQEQMLNEQKKRHEQELAQVLQSLDEQFKNQKEEWVTTIFDHIVSRQ